MTPVRMEAIHAASFAVPRPWSEAEFRDLIGDSLILRAVEGDLGFALARAVAGEAELLTIAVLPSARKAGVGTGLVQALLNQARVGGAKVMFLEVAEDNLAAVRLYERLGFKLAGRRPRYYDGRIDALIYRRPLAG